MLKTCVTCGRIHWPPCQSKREDKRIDRFRHTQLWVKKSMEIRERDNYLCQCCIRNLYDTETIYNCMDIDAHHIVPLCDDYGQRLDNDNIVSLCRKHHKMADAGKIPRSEQTEWTREEYRVPPGVK